MNLPKKYHWNLKFIVMSITLILAISSVSNVSGQVYHFEEDFSGVPDEDWRFGAWFYPPSRNFENASHTWTFDDELVSAGEPDGRRTNYAFINDTTTFGAWNFDVFIPIDPLTTVWDYSFSIEWDYISVSSYFGEPNKTDWPEFNLGGVGDGLSIEAWNKTRDPSSSRLKFDRSGFGLKFDIYQRFDVIRTPDNFYVYIDKELILDTEFSSNFGPEINYFGVSAAQGSGVKFDNFQITKDYEKVLDGLPPPPIESGPKLPPIVWAGIGVVAVVTTFGSYQYFKKKGIND